MVVPANCDFVVICFFCKIIFLSNMNITYYIILVAILFDLLVLSTMLTFVTISASQIKLVIILFSSYFIMSARCMLKEKETYSC